MTTFSRRQFLVGTCAVAAGTAGTVAVTWSDLLRRAIETPFTADTPILVLVTLYGGNDGLNTVVPYTNDAYFAARPTLSYAPDEVLQLDEGLGLNPALQNLRTQWDRGELAIIRGVGYPEPSRSHVRSMDVWQSGSPDKPGQTGWIGRWLDSAEPGPASVLNIGPIAPLLARGNQATGACLDLAGELTGLRRALSVFGADEKTDTTAQSLVRAAFRADDEARSRLSNKIPYPTRDRWDTRIRGQLALVANAIRVGVPVRVYSVSLYGFDTHADQRDQHETLLAELDSALRAFLPAVQDYRVTVAAYSEFGRRVGENSSGGTDHGTAGPMFVIGRGVRGGLYGDEPTFTDGDLAVTTDFRDVYSTLLSGPLDTDPEQVLGKGRSAIPFLQS